MPALVVGKDVAARVDMRVEMSSAYPPAGAGTITSVLSGGQHCSVLWDSGQETRHSVGDQNRFELVSSGHQYSQPVNQDPYTKAAASRNGQEQGSLFNRSDLKKRKAKSLVEDAMVELSNLETSFNKPPVHRQTYTSDAENRPKTTLGLGLKGLQVDYVIPGGPAHISEQLEKGDQILTIDRQPVGPETITRQIIGSDMPGTPIRLEVVKQSSRHTVEVNLVRASMPAMQSSIKVFERILELRLNAESIRAQEEALFPKRRTTQKILEQLEEAINIEIMDKHRQLKNQQDSLRDSSRKMRQNLEASLDEFESFATEQQALLHSIDDAMRDHDNEEKNLHSKMQELMNKAEKSAEEAAHYRRQLDNLEGGTPEAQALRSVVQSQDKELSALKSVVASREKELVGLRASGNRDGGRVEELEEALRESARQIETAQAGLSKADSYIKEQALKLKEQERSLQAQHRMREFVQETQAELSFVRRAQAAEYEDISRQARAERASRMEAGGEVQSLVGRMASIASLAQSVREDARMAHAESSQLELARMANQLENVTAAYKQARRDAQGMRDANEHLNRKVGELERLLGDLSRQVSVLEAEAVAREKLLTEAEREEGLLHKRLEELARSSDAAHDRDMRLLRADLAKAKQRCAVLERTMVRLKGLAMQVHADSGALSVGEGSVSRAIPGVMDDLQEQSRVIRARDAELRQLRLEAAGVRERLAKAQQKEGHGDRQKDEAERLLVDARAQQQRLRGEVKRLQSVESDNKELREMNGSLREVIATMENSVEREKRSHRETEDMLREAKLTVFEQAQDLAGVKVQLEHERDEVARLGAKSQVQDKRNKELRVAFDLLQRKYEDATAEANRLQALVEDLRAQLQHKEEALQTYRAQAVGADAAYAEAKVTAERAEKVQADLLLSREMLSSVRKKNDDVAKELLEAKQQVAASEGLQDEIRNQSERGQLLQQNLINAETRNQELRKQVEELRVNSAQARQAADVERQRNEGQEAERNRLQRELDGSRENLHSQLRVLSDKCNALQGELTFVDAALGHCHCKQTLETTVVAARNLPADLQRVTVAVSVDGGEQAVTTTDAVGTDPRFGEVLRRPLRSASRELVVSLYSSPQDSGVGSLVGFAVVQLAKVGAGPGKEEWLTLHTRPNGDAVGDVVRSAGGAEAQVSLRTCRKETGADEEAALQRRVQELLASIDVHKSNACARPADHVEIAKVAAERCPRREDHVELQLLKSERDRVLKDKERLQSERGQLLRDAAAPPVQKQSPTPLSATRAAAPAPPPAPAPTPPKPIPGPTLSRAASAASRRSHPSPRKASPSGAYSPRSPDGVLLGSAGMVVTKAEPGGEILVKSLVPGGAVQRDGRIQARDRVLSVDGMGVTGVELAHVFNLIGGPPGSQVTLHMEREWGGPNGGPWTFLVDIVRESAGSPSSIPRSQSVPVGSPNLPGHHTSSPYW